MIGNENILSVPVFFLFRKSDEIISETHSIEHPETPESDELISILVMLFIKG